MISPEEFIETKSSYDPIQRCLSILVVHLARDKATGSVNVCASIGGPTFSADLPRSGWYRFDFQIPPGEKKVRWRVGVERNPQVFAEEIETPPAPPT
jgi:hypothetical protein